MTTNFLQSGWSDLDSAELRLILLERIGKPGQYDGRDSNPNTFYLPLAGSSCRIKLTFSDSKQIVAIEPGPAFDAAQWKQVVEEIERTGPYRVGRDCSFSSFRVAGCWRGKRSGVQILPPPADAPQAPYETAEHPFILEYPVKVSDLWPITNFRRMREHRRLTFLLNVLLAGSTTMQPRRPRHLWGIVHDEAVAGAYEAKWVQEYYFAKFGEAVRDDPSPPDTEILEEIDPETYYAKVGHDGRGLRVPADLDDSICCFMQLSKTNRDKFVRAGFWRDMAHRQWTVSLSASFASLVIAIESLGERSLSPTKRFSTFIEQYASGVSPGNRRRMYDLRSDILHGSGLMEMDQDTHFGWSPPEQNERDLMDELWGLTRIAMRNWLKNPPPI